MGTTVSHSASPSLPTAATRSRRIVNFMPGLFGLFGVMAIMAAYRVYQQVYAFSAGLDSTLPDFETYWMNLLKVELVVLVTC